MTMHKHRYLTDTENYILPLVVIGVRDELCNRFIMISLGLGLLFPLLIN